MKISDIKPVGNFDKILNDLRKKADSIIDKCNKEQKYNSSLAKLIKLIINDLGIIDVLEEGVIEKSGWNNDEMIMCLLYTHLIIIDLNNTAHKYLNNIEPLPIDSQLQDYINGKKNIYGDIKIESL